MHNISHNTQNVKQVPSQLNTTLVELLDHTLAQIRYYRARFLATGDDAEWRLWQAYEQDRAALLREVA